MENSKLHSIQIDGLGTYGGGEFEKVSIAGSGKFTESVKSEKFQVSGIGTLLGELETKKLGVSGTCKVEGNILAENIDVSGVLKCAGNVEVSEEFRVNGMTKIEQCLKANTVKGRGFLEVKEDISGEMIEIEGVLNCGKFLNCEVLVFTGVGTSVLNEIGAARIRIKQGYESVAKFLGPFMPKMLKENKVVANTIEGDEIILENCEVKVVRGKNVKIGKGCRIAVVEYSDQIDIDSEAVVDTVNQI